MLNRIRYGVHATFRNPGAAINEMRARLAQPKINPNSVANLPYVQICGTLKSGITLLQSLLDNTPGVATYPHDTQLTGIFYNCVRNAKDPKELTELLNWCHELYLQNRLILKGRDPESWENVFGRDLIIRTKTNMSHLLGSCSDFWDIHAAFLDSYLAEAGGTGFTRWVDQSPYSHHYYDEIKATRPDAKFIHVLRHPVGTFSSKAVKFLRNKNVSDIELEELARMESELIRNSFEFAYANRDKPDYMIVRYGDLCKDPETLTRRICEFIGIDHHDQLFRPTLGGQPFYGINMEGIRYQSISTDSLDRWRRRLPPYYANVVCHQVTDLMREFGYELPNDRSEIARDYDIHVEACKQLGPVYIKDNVRWTDAMVRCGVGKHPLPEEMPSVVMLKDAA